MQKAEPLTLGFLQALTRDRSAEDYWKQARATSPSTSTGQRAALAQWITDPKQGAGALLARVIVNRVWQQHFGEGLVRTAGDFGLQGDKPSHPELLDWLAGELIRSGWRLKTIERMILSSEVYSEDTSWDGARAKVDPENRLLWRRRPQRLTGEELRDAVLLTSGRLQAEAFGPGFKPPVPAEAMSTRSADKYPDKAEDGPALWKRAVYMYVKRSVRFPMMEVFDAPEPLSACSRRAVTTAPTQQLTLLNDPFIRLRAADFANRIAIAKPGDMSGQVRLAFQLALGRSPQAAEMAKAVTFIQTRQSMGAPEILAWTDFCHALFTLNEFIYVD
nr:DUF1553 domain-containing protein [Verrucomicrobium sp. BvORR106]